MGPMTSAAARAKKLGIGVPMRHGPIRYRHGVFSNPSAPARRAQTNLEASLMT